MTPNVLRNYPGSKFNTGFREWLISQQPPHDCYIEAFLGAGAILQTKQPATTNIGIELSERVAGAWLATPQPGRNIIWGDALATLPTLNEFHQPTTLVYADPPYLKATRRNQRNLYECEFASAAEHLRLLALLNEAKCMVMLSGYHSELYHSQLKGWRRAEFQTVTHRGQPATEVVWMNFPVPIELHDYRFLGQGFRERHRIKKKQKRWLRRLQAMPTLERYALLSVINQLRPSSPETASHDVSSNTNDSAARSTSHTRE